MLWIACYFFWRPLPLPLSGKLLPQLLLLLWLLAIIEGCLYLKMGSEAFLRRYADGKRSWF